MLNIPKPEYNCCNKVWIAAHKRLGEEKCTLCGRTSKYLYEYIPVQITITEVSLEDIGDDTNTYDYSYGGYTDNSEYIQPDYIFKSEKECIKFCKEKNK